jgi:hypothetical protein
MQTISLNERQSRELCDEVGKMLAAELDSEAIRNKVNRLTSDYVKNNNISADANSITKNLTWSGKVQLNR